MAVTGGSSDPNAGEQLRAHIVELEETLHAIRSGGVDAVLIGQPGAERIYTLTSAERPYKTIVDSMSEGALTVSARGIILFANRRFTQMIGTDLSQIVGVLATLVQQDAFGRLDGLLAVGPGGLTRADLELITSHGPETVSVSATGLEIDGVYVRCLIATDVTSQQEARVHLEGEVAARTADLQRVNATMAEANRTLRVVTSGHQALIRATDEASLMDAICRTIVESGDYRLAWVGQAENDEAQSVRPIGAAGETAYLDEIEVSWGPGPLAVALQGGRSRQGPHRWWRTYSPRVTTGHGLEQPRLMVLPPCARSRSLPVRPSAACSRSMRRSRTLSTLPRSPCSGGSRTGTSARSASPVTEPTRSWGTAVPRGYCATSTTPDGSCAYTAARWPR